MLTGAPKKYTHISHTKTHTDTLATCWDKLTSTQQAIITEKKATKLNSELHLDKGFKEINIYGFDIA